MLPNEKASERIMEDVLQANLEGGNEDGASLTATPTPTGSQRRKNLGVAFADATLAEPASQSSSTYKEALSQPARTLSHRQRLQWLQRRRDVGLWVQCDLCDQWRHLPHVLDAFELPQQWRCDMNPDSAYSRCSVPEARILVREEEDMIHGPYSCGSVVWARLTGWPWWPAMVDDEPDTEQFYWLDGFSDIPTYYNVTFFDEGEVTHAWIATNQLKPYAANRGMAKQLAKNRNHKKRLGAAISQAEHALRLPQQDRLAKYSFIARFTGDINEPRKVSKAELKKFTDRLKRKYNIDFTDGSSYESDAENFEMSKRKRDTPYPGRNKNAMAPKAKREKKTIVAEPKNTKKEANLIVPVEKVVEAVNESAPSSVALQPNHENTVCSTIAEGSFDNDTSDTYVPPPINSTQSTAPEAELEDTDRTIIIETPKTRNRGSCIVTRRLQDSMLNCSGMSGESDQNGPTEKVAAIFKQPSSMTVQVGSNGVKEAISAMEGSFDNDTSKTYVPETESPTMEAIDASIRDDVCKLQKNIASGSSDDFDF